MLEDLVVGSILWRGNFSSTNKSLCMHRRSFTQPRKIDLLITGSRKKINIRDHN